MRLELKSKLILHCGKVAYLHVSDNIWVPSFGFSLLRYHNLNFSHPHTTNKAQQATQKWTHETKCQIIAPSSRAQFFILFPDAQTITHTYLSSTMGLSVKLTHVFHRESLCCYGVGGPPTP